MIGFGLIIPLLPIYAREMGASGVYLGLLTSLFGITRSITSLPGGVLADKLGRKKLIVTGLFVYTVVMFLFGISTVWPVAATMVADIVPAKDRGKAMGVFSMMWDAGIAVGPVLGGVLSALFTMAVPFFVCSFMAFISALLMLNRVTETHVNPEIPVEKPMDGLSFHRVSLIGICITGFTASFAMGLVHPILPLFGNEVIGLNEAAIGVIFGAMGVTRFMVKPPSGAFADSVGRKKVVIIGLTLNGIFTSVIALSKSFFTILAPAVARAVGLGMTLPSMNALVTSLTTTEKRGKVMGIFSASRNLGLVAGPLLGGIAFDTISTQAPFFICGVIVFLGVGILAVMVQE
jgi:MFS family permease